MPDRAPRRDQGRPTPSSARRRSSCSGQPRFAAGLAGLGWSTWATLAGAPARARAAERNIERGPYFAGDRIHVVDLKIYMAVRWFNGGKVDHIPATIFAGYPKLMRVHDAVRDHAGVKSWYARG